MDTNHLVFLRSRIIAVAFIISLSTAIGSNACEICGCGNNNFQIGILPTFNRGFFGLRYTGSQFHSVMRDDPAEFSHDYYQTTELWGGLTVKRFHVIAFLPYFSGKKVSDDGTTLFNGLGDAMVLVNHKVWSRVSLSANEKTTRQNELYFGGGVKLPTGLNTVDTSNPDFNIGDFNSQAGTGSVDFLVNATHNLMWNRSGVVTNVAYRINTANQQGYRFGNRAYLNTSYYHSFNVGSLKIKPNGGLNLQANDINTFNGSTVADSNGYIISSTIGLNVLRDKIGVSAMTFVPLAQNMYDGQTKLQSRLVLGLTYSF